MRTVALIARKGGGGKSTLTAHLAVESSRRYRTAIVDVDSQRSLTDWWNLRADPDPSHVTVDIGRIQKQSIALNGDGYERLFIDTPPYPKEFESEVAKVVKVADLVLVPVRPSPLDLRAIGPTVALIAKMKTPYVFVLNGGTVGARMNVEAAAFLKGPGPLESVPVVKGHGSLGLAYVHNRVDFSGSMIDGRTAGELSSTSAAAREITMLWKFVDKQLRKGA